MLKYVNTDIVFQEIPDEVTLALTSRIVLAIVLAVIAIISGMTSGCHWTRRR